MLSRRVVDVCLISTDGTENHKQIIEDLQRELLELKAAAQTIVDLVDPVEDSSSSSSTLIERLRRAPHCWHFLTSLLEGVSSQQRRKKCRRSLRGTITMNWLGP